MTSRCKLILVADDEPHVTYMLIQKLSAPGVTVVAAGDGAEALRMACDQQPDLIITDYQMPRLSGFDMALQLRSDARTADIPLIMLTARGHRLSPSELAQTNIRHLMSKPFSVRDLQAKIAEFLDTGDSERAAA